jgi:hypothetical protein
MAMQLEDTIAFKAAEFHREYERLSELGACDLPDGGEYTRVKDEWFNADCPRPIEAFIRRRANWVPGDDPAAADASSVAYGSAGETAGLALHDEPKTGNS